jgi:hypothetical protein
VSAAVDFSFGGSSFYYYIFILHTLYRALTNSYRGAMEVDEEEKRMTTTPQLKNTTILGGFSPEKKRQIVKKLLEFKKNREERKKTNHFIKIKTVPWSHIGL